VLFGLFMLFSGVSGLLAGSSMEGIPEAMVPSMQNFLQTGIFHMIKITEIVAGLMLVTGFLPALAAIFIAPIAVGVMVFNFRMSPANLPMGVIVCALEAYLGYAYWDKYKALFQR
jgi:hypothetical protein